MDTLAYRDLCPVTIQVHRVSYVCDKPDSTNPSEDISSADWSSHSTQSSLESQGLVLDGDLGLGLVQPMMPIGTRFSPSYPCGQGHVSEVFAKTGFLGALAGARRFHRPTPWSDHSRI